MTDAEAIAILSYAQVMVLNRNPDKFAEAANRAILALDRDRQASRKKPTMCDKIRSMSDEELTAAIYQLIYATADPALWFCKGKKECGDLMDADKEIPEEMCRKCLLEKLRQPVEDPAPATMAEYEKQHSGLLEED